MSDFHETEEQVVARLRTALSQSDPVPTDVVEFAKAAFTWRDIDAELAGLDYDSAAEEATAGVRSTATARMLSFQAGQWMLDIDFDVTSGVLRGQISPGAQFSVEIHTTGALFSVDSDSQGRFSADGIAPGPLGMVLRFSDGGVIKTQWVVL